MNGGLVNYENDTHIIRLYDFNRSKHHWPY